MIEGDGGNVGVSVGSDGLLIVDDEFGPLAPKLRTALASLSPLPVRFVIDTHWHPDHTNGNEAMAQAGAVLVAHENVRRRMSTPQFIGFLAQNVVASPAKALPVVTFSDVLTLHLNGDDIRVVHLPSAHTDGDAVVYFTRANVVHMGDLLLTNGSYPIIDYTSGGTVDGYIAALDAVLAATGPDTRIIAGHGPPCDRARLQQTRDVVKAVRDAVARAASGGKSLEQVLALRPSAPWDDEWGQAFVKPDVLVTMIYRTLPR
jgi:glyoxylase-like metal-dependent hydrolase (beta-lactamase superfamily II)